MSNYFTYAEAMKVVTSLSPLERNGETLDFAKAMEIVTTFEESTKLRIMRAQLEITDILAKYKLSLVARLLLEKETTAKMLAEYAKDEQEERKLLLHTELWELVPVESLLQKKG